MQVVDGGEERIWKVGVISGHYCAFMDVGGDCRTGTGVRRWRGIDDGINIPIEQTTTII
jgi:hypothetical protein